MKVVFIGGLGRSGSTLLERMLGSLPGTCALGEVKSVWRRVTTRDDRCGCDTNIADCAFWKTVGEKAFGGWGELDLRSCYRNHRKLERFKNIPALSRRTLPSEQERAVLDHVDLYRRLYTAAAEISGADVVIDSSKSPGLAFCLRWAPNLDIHYVHLVRDPRGVAYSFTKRVIRPEANWVDTMPRRKPRVTAANWMVNNLAISGLSWWARGNARTVQRIRYEDLLTSPASTVQAIAAAVGVTVPPEKVARLERRRVEITRLHSIAGNPMRYHTGEVELRQDDAWRAKLSAYHRHQVTAICAPLLAAYGYRGR